jgi:hypothetical protein
VSLSGTAKPYRAHVLMHAFAAVNPDGANERSRDLTLATWRHANARKCGIRMALLHVHRESNYDAHRLPAGKTAAERKVRDVLRVRQWYCPRIDNIDCPRHQSFFDVHGILIGRQSQRQVKRL